MAPLSQASARAIARLRNYVPPPTNFLSLPVSRRAAVLILLFADRYGDLRVVLTVRSSTLKSYPGQVAFPGGKADTLEETPFQIARREAEEEIGLPRDDRSLPAPYRMEHLCELPSYLAVTELGVRPCVGFLSTGDSTNILGDAEENLIPRLNAKEVASVFTAPLHNFLRSYDESAEDGRAKDSPWYEGSWNMWQNESWRMHRFYVPDRRKSRLAGEVVRNRVFGLTARVLVDTARLAYDEMPDFEYNDYFGEEHMIGKLLAVGRLGDKRKSDDRITAEDVQKVGRMSADELEKAGKEKVSREKGKM
ncbi:MAG: hypothetical protein MMC33_008001 [Icmadophila ericetorum]|nr:hypothetical protein [Icmadophila ericetorum]